MSLEDDRLELLRLGENLAAARLELTFRRWGVESKFRPDQARVPAGNGIESGRFAKEIRNAIRAGKHVAKPAARGAGQAGSTCRDCAGGSSRSLTRTRRSRVGAYGRNSRHLPRSGFGKRRRVRWSQSHWRDGNDADTRDSI